MSMSFVRLCALSSVLVAGAGTMAQAAPVDITYATADPAGRNVYFTLHGTESAGRGGPFELTVTPDGGGAPSRFISWCIDLAQYISDGTYHMSSTAPDGSTGGGAIGPQQENLLSQLFDSYLGLAGVNRDNATSFQIAIWEIVYDGASGPLDVSPSSGDFFVRSTGGSNDESIISTANTWLSALDSGSAGIARLVYFTSDTRQDQVSLAPVPLPAGVVLLLSGIGGFVALRRRRKTEI